MEQNYRFDDEQTAIDAEQWLVDKAAELGMPFIGVTQRWAVPQAERLPSSDPMELGEPTGKWVFPRIPAEVTSNMSQETILEFLNTFQPEIV